MIKKENVMSLEALVLGLMNVNNTLAESSSNGETEELDRAMENVELLLDTLEFYAENQEEMLHTAKDVLLMGRAINEADMFHDNAEAILEDVDGGPEWAEEEPNKKPVLN